MFPHAADEVKENSDRFSPCSLRHMSHLLKIKKDKCFVGETSNSASRKKLLDQGWAHVHQEGHIPAYFCLSLIYYTWFNSLWIWQLSNESNLCRARSWLWWFVWTCLHSGSKKNPEQIRQIKSTTKVKTRQQNQKHDNKFKSTAVNSETPQKIWKKDCKSENATTKQKKKREPCPKYK